MVKWKVEGLFKGNAEKCFNEIQEIGDSYTPDDIVEKAKDETSELHKCFDWDDTVAAHKWRKHTARIICNSLVLVVQKEEKEPKMFKLIQNTGLGDGYEPSIKVYSNPSKYNALLERMKADAVRFVDRYETLDEAAQIIYEMRKVI